MDEIRLYTIAEVTVMLKVTKATVYSYIKSGKITAVKMGKYWRVPHQSIEKFLAAGSTAPKI